MHHLNLALGAQPDLLFLGPSRTRRPIEEMPRAWGLVMPSSISTYQVPYIPKVLALSCPTYLPTPRRY